MAAHEECVNPGKATTKSRAPRALESCPVASIHRVADKVGSRKPVYSRSDAYALGSVLRVMALARAPYRPHSLIRTCIDIQPKSIRRLRVAGCRRCVFSVTKLCMSQNLWARPNIVTQLYETPGLEGNVVHCVLVRVAATSPDKFGQVVCHRIVLNETG